VCIVVGCLACIAVDVFVYCCSCVVCNFVSCLVCIVVVVVCELL